MNLIQNAGRVILHEDLLGMTWGPEYRNDLQYLRVWVEPAAPQARARARTTRA